jgi:hypothetical protein
MEKDLTGIVLGINIEITEHCLVGYVFVNTKEIVLWPDLKRGTGKMSARWY